MNILIASLLKRKLTPEMNSSRPRIIYQIIQGLIAKGHTVTVLATGDSVIPGATVIPIIPQSFVDLPPFENPLYAEVSLLSTLAKKIEEIAPEFDIIHNHTYPEIINLYAGEQITTPMVTTIHTQPFPEFDTAMSQFTKTFCISISQAHRALFKKTPIYDVVYNGIDTAIYTYEAQKDDYLLWLGRLSKAKNADGSFFDPKGIKWAIQLAQQTGQRLLLSGNVEDMEFFNRDVKPHLNEKIQWIGPVSNELSLSRSDVVKLMQKARAFLMTINWYEPFGLVMAEAMSCGTPVIAFDRGAVPELIVDGKTGFIVPHEDGISGLVEAYNKLSTIQPLDCRRHVEEHFTIEKMVDNYEKVYQKILQNRT